MSGPSYADSDVTLWHGDCVQVMRGMDDNSVHAIVTDPPYGLEFMGKDWDSFRVDDPGTARHRGERAGAQGSKGSTDERWTGGDGRSMPSNRVNYGGPNRPRTNRCQGCGKRDQFRSPHACVDGTPWQSEVIDPNSAPPQSLAFQAWCQTWAVEALRVLKPGGHLLAFGGTRTFHRLTCAIEDAGFEIRDSIASYGGTIPGPFATLTWVQGQGFPKSLNVAAAIMTSQGLSITDDPITSEAEPWQGYGTALRPAHEPIVVARKPLTGTVAANVQRWGTGALNIDATRIPHGPDVDLQHVQRQGAANDIYIGGAKPGDIVPMYKPGGRWPSNVVLTHSASCADRCADGCPVRELDQQSGVRTSGGGVKVPEGSVHGFIEGRTSLRKDSGKVHVPDTGSASRFFPTFRYEAKAPTLERPSYVKDGAGDHRAGGNFAGGIRVCQVCDNRTKPPGSWSPGDERPWPACGHEQWEWGTPMEKTGRVAHPTTKPLDLMRWLCRLVCPPDGTILDMFAGSGTTLEAALLEGFNSVGIEQDADYLPLIAERIRRGKARGHQPDLFGGAA